MTTDVCTTVHHRHKFSCYEYTLSTLYGPLSTFLNRTPYFVHQKLQGNFARLMS